MFFFRPIRTGRSNAVDRQDMGLLNENRSLVHTGRFLRQDAKGFGGNEWTELFALLFDNYRKGIREVSFRVPLTDSPIVVMTKPKAEGGVTKYHVYQRASHVRSFVAARLLIRCTAHPAGPSYIGDFR